MRKWIAVPIIAGALFGVGAAAMAATGFDVPGTASVSGSVGTVTPTTASGALVGVVYPGHSNDCTVTFDNPNSVPVTITSLHAVSVTSAGGTTDVATYESAGYGTIPDLTISVTVPKKTGSTDGTASPTISNCLVNANPPAGSEGATFTINYTSDGATA
jgi:hypothetical protein